MSERQWLDGRSGLDGPQGCHESPRARAKRTCFGECAPKPLTTSVCVDNAEGMLELKRKLAEVDEALEKKAGPGRSEQSDGNETTEMGGRRSPSRTFTEDPQPKRQHVQQEGSNDVAQTAHDALCEVNAPSSPKPSGKEANEVRPHADETYGRPSDVISGQRCGSRSEVTTHTVTVGSSGAVSSPPEVAASSRARQASCQTTSGLVVQEVSSEQWEELRRPTPPWRPPGHQTALVQEVDTDDGSESGGVITPDTPPRGGCGARQHPLVQEVDTDDGSEGGSEGGGEGGSVLTPGTPPRGGCGARHHPLAGVTIEEQETLRYAAEEEEQWGDEEWIEEEAPESPAPVRVSPVVMAGVSERACFFTLRSLTSLRSARGCLSPMPEETAEEMECEDSASESLPARSRERDDVREVCAESLPVESRVRQSTDAEVHDHDGDVSLEEDDRKADSEHVNNGSSKPVELIVEASLPNEARLRGPEETVVTTFRRSLPNETRRRKMGTASAPLPGEARRREPDDMMKAATEALSNETRRQETEEEMVTTKRHSLPNEASRRHMVTMSESLTNETMRREPEDIRITESSALPNETRIMIHEVATASTLKQSLSNETQMGDPTNSATSTVSEPLRHEVGNTSPGVCEANTCSHSLQSNPPTTTEPEEQLEVLDRSDDKRYNFSALRMKRKQAQLASETHKEGHPSRSPARHVQQTANRKHSKEGHIETTKANENASICRDGARSSANSGEDNATYVVSNTSGTVSERIVPHKTLDEANETEKRMSSDPAQDLAETTPGGRRPASGHLEQGDRKGQTEAAVSGAGGALGPHLDDLTPVSGSATSVSAASTPRTPGEIIGDLESDTNWRTVLPLWSGTPAQRHSSDQAPEAPSVVTSLADTERYVTESLVLTVEVRGRPPPEARWIVKPFLSSEVATSVCT